MKKMRKRLAAIIRSVFGALLLAALISSCGGGGGGSSTPTVSTTPATIHVENSSTHTIDFLLAAPSSSPTWDYVDNTPLASGESRDLSSLPPNASYDFCARSAGYEACTWGFNLASGATVTFTIHDADFGGRLNVVNNTGVQITELYVKGHSGTVWSDNLLGSTPLGIGSTLALNAPVGTWDFRVFYSGAYHDYTAGITITGFTTSTLNVP